MENLSAGRQSRTGMEAPWSSGTQASCNLGFHHPHHPYHLMAPDGSLRLEHHRCFPNCSKGEEGKAYLRRLSLASH